ncbi:hypothetical protein O181_018671 [Austropuccinia psidii MF-1]|uniref:PCI domain-containing protein n=1 Tax=Austropuccinia psidii MF-1 TaxID=1389203 RepID=A0A9Q3CA25_9BASI|nr:hypothetical protein [Austropuccinia psidii MF-1]
MVADVHDLDHVKLGLADEQSSSSNSKSIPSFTTSTHLNQSIKTNHKLEYILTLLESTKGIGVIKLIEDALGCDGIYVFGEILQVKAVSELAHHPIHSAHYELLKIFAYGNWKQYREKVDQLPGLNSAQARKLKQLSIISRASQSRIIPYSELLEQLEIDQIQELEELVIDAIYNGLLKARLDQKRARIELESCMGRDVQLIANDVKDGGDIEMDGRTFPTNSILELKSKLESWRNCTAKVLDQVDQQIALIRRKEQAILDYESNQQATIETIVQSLTASSHEYAGASKGKDKDLGLNDQLMDVDDPSTSSSKTRKRTRP